MLFKIRKIDFEIVYIICPCYFTVVCFGKVFYFKNEKSLLEW